MGRPTPDLTGQQFGRLLAIRRIADRAGAAWWLCRCDCGAHIEARASQLARGKTKSCGCLRREFSTLTKTTHGHGSKRRRSPLYNVWNGMRQRCSNPNQPHYERYGGRGIKVCDRWQKFENFLADMGERPGPEYSLDRIDQSGNYEPGNVRWATRSEQRKNARTGTLGSRHGMSKLTEADVRAIRQSSLTGAQLARAFRVAPSAISAIRRRRTWKHIE